MGLGVTVATFTVSGWAGTGRPGSSGRRALLCQKVVHQGAVPSELQHCVAAHAFAGGA